MNEQPSLSDKERRAQEKALQSATDRTQARQQSLSRLGKYLGIVAVLGLVIGGVAWLGSQNNSNYLVASPSEVTETDWKKGNPGASVRVIEYADLQCPGCAYYNNQIVSRLYDEYGDRVLFVYRHFPLRSLHRNADNSAQAAEAAGKQGKFWEMLNLLFANQTSWESLASPKDTFAGYAESLGLNAEQFATDYSSNEAKDKINADYKSAIAAGIGGTPSFFINGQYHDLNTAPGYEGLKTAIEAALAKQSQNPVSE